MKKIFLTLALTLSLITGFSAASVYANDDFGTVQNNDGRIYIKVFEDGAIWVYVYEQDGTFVSKFIEDEL